MDKGFDYSHFKTLESTHQERWQVNWDSIDNMIANITQEQTERLNIPLRLLVIAEGWCWDSAKAFLFDEGVNFLFLRSDRNKYYFSNTAGDVRGVDLLISIKDCSTK